MLPSYVSFVYGAIKSVDTSERMSLAVNVSTPTLLTMFDHGIPNASSRTQNALSLEATETTSLRVAKRKAPTHTEPGFFHSDDNPIFFTLLS
jgi:hypothetical protein